MDERIRKLMRAMKDLHATDLHITVGVRPQYRIFADIQPADCPPLTPEDARTMIYSLINDQQRRRLEREKELDCSVGIAGESRYRINVFFQRGSIAAALRRLPFEVPGLDELGLPADVLRNLCQKSRGMVLVTGPTGSGKSTTLAAMIGYINRNFCKHIICVEDPIEYLHNHRKSIVEQREVGQDTHSFASALKHILRQDPDVVQIGEMRDMETMSSMLTVAETGHLALSTLHTNTAVSTINRIIDVFPHDQQEQVRVQLSFVLEAVIAQQLLPTAAGRGVVLAYEIMVVNPAIRNLVRERQIEQIYSHLQMGREAGMKTMNACLAELVESGKITKQTARSKCTDLKELTSLLKAM